MEVKKGIKLEWIVLQWCQGVVGASGFLDSGASSSRTPPEQPKIDSLAVGRVAEPQKGQADTIRFGRLW